MKKVIFALSLIAISTVAICQKTAYIRFDSVLKNTPDADTITKKYNAYSKQFIVELQNEQNEFKNKYADYQKNQSTYPQVLRDKKEKELQTLNQQIDDFQKQVQNNLRHFADSLETPVIDKIKKVIASVAKEKGYTAVIDLSQGTIIYYQSKDDIYEPVMKVLKAGK